MVNTNGIANRGEAEGRRTVLGVLTFCHLLNDYYFMIIPPLLPFLARDFQLTFFQSGLLVFIINIVSAFLQPIIGYFADLKMLRRFVIVVGLLIYALSFIALGVVPNYVVLLLVLFLMGIGGSTFHPKALTSSPRTSRDFGQPLQAFMGLRIPSGLCLHLSLWRLSLA